MKNILLIVAVMALGITSVATAQPRNCFPRAAVVERLAELHSESRQAIGLASDGSITEIFASEESGSWTLIVTRAGGPTCLVAAGQAFQITNDPLPNTDQEG